MIKWKLYDSSLQITFSQFFVTFPLSSAQLNEGRHSNQLYFFQKNQAKLVEPKLYY